MTQNKKTVGITGGSGAGKSYISELLRERGYTVIDADETAHESINGAECAAELSEYFGAEILSGGRINRKKLGEIVFSEPEKLKKLNEITHKYILKDIRNKIGTANSDIVFVDGAVLIESGMECDFMIGVISDREIRKKRIIERDGITEEEASRRISAQQKDSFYRKNCDMTVENNGKKVDIDRILKRVTG